MQEKSKIYLSCLFLFFVFQLSGYENEPCSKEVEFKLEAAQVFLRSDLDSLKLFGNQALEQAKTCKLEGLTIDALILLGDGNLNFGYMDEAVKIYDSAIQNSIENKLLKKQIIGLYKKGRAYILKDKPDSAISCYKENLVLLNEHVFTDTLWRDQYLGRSMGNLGVVYNNLGIYDLALDYFLKVLKLNEKLNNERGISFTLNNIGTIYLRNNEEEKALPYLERSLELKRKLNDVYAIPEAYLNIGGVYYAWDQYKEALVYFDSAKIYSEQTQNPRTLANALLNVGACFNEMNVIDSAIFYYNKVVGLTDDKIPGTASMAYRNLAKLSVKSKNYRKATYYSNQSLEMAKKSGGLPELVNSTESIAQVKFESGSLKSAYEERLKYEHLKDSLFNKQKSKELNELMVSFETEKKEQQIINLNNEKQIKELELQKSESAFNLILSLVVVLVLMSGLIILFINQRRLKEQQKSLNLEQKLLRTQMNPHFIFNSLNSIQKFILKNESLDAADYLSQFANLMRAILESSRLENITLEKEVAILNNYLKLQQLRFGGKFDYEIIMDEDIDVENTIIPPMLTQPFIENAIEHGMKGIDYKGKVIVRIIKSLDKIKLEVEDNGIGIQNSLELSRESKTKHVSMAMNITKERLGSLSKKIDFELKDLSAQSLKGTLVSFTLPLKFAS